MEEPPPPDPLTPVGAKEVHSTRVTRVLPVNEEPEKLFPYRDMGPPTPNGMVPYLLYRLLKKKPFSAICDDTRSSNFKRTLGPFDLTMLCVSELVGVGALVLTGSIAANHAGPAVVLSYLLASIIAFLCALCYCELSALIPLTGSSYTFAYFSFGEIIAWAVGWDMCLEYLAVAAVVAVGWSAYLQSFLHDLGITVDPRLMKPPFKWDTEERRMVASDDGIVNLGAMSVVAVITMVLIMGIRESSTFNALVAFVKVGIILLFIVVLAPRCEISNWTPFIPPNQGTYGHFGLTGVLQGATSAFFSFIGLDSVSVCVQECRNPQRDVPIGMLAGLTISALMYMGVSVVATGVLPYTAYKGISYPLTYAIKHTTGKTYRWLSILTNIGALSGMTSVILVSLLAQPRIFYAMAADGLLPPAITRVHPRFKTPHYATLISGTVCVLLAGLLPMEVLAELTSVGTLFAFTLSCLGVLVLRYKEPNRYRPFRVPGGKLIPLLGAVTSTLLLFTASWLTLCRLLVWFGIGLVIYAVYGYRKSRLRIKVRLPGIQDVHLECHGHGCHHE